MKLKKIHHAILFQQSAWLKPYIDLNTEKRNKLKIWLMNNLVFEKTMQNVRRINVEQVHSYMRLRKCGGQSSTNSEFSIGAKKANQCGNEHPRTQLDPDE